VRTPVSRDFHVCNDQGLGVNLTVQIRMAKLPETAEGRYQRALLEIHARSSEVVLPSEHIKCRRRRPLCASSDACRNYKDRAHDQV
jgi:hypothetical protein